jgi:hypothetical protein
MLDAIQHLSEYYATYSFEFSGMLQMSDHSIDLVRLGIKIFEDQD